MRRHNMGAALSKLETRAANTKTHGLDPFHAFITPEGNRWKVAEHYMRYPVGTGVDVKTFYVDSPSDYHGNAGLVFIDDIGD